MASVNKPLTLSVTIAILLHIPINYLLVPFTWGLGVRGVALASSWNTININLGLLAYLLLSSNLGWDLTSMPPVCLERWRYEVMLILCGLLPGPRSTVAATGVLIQTTGLLYVVPYSLSMGLATCVWQELGAHQPRKAERAANDGLAAAAACGFSAFLFTLAVRRVWGKTLTSDPKILALVSAVLPIIGL